MAKFCSLYSSSSGNSTYIGTSQGGILIDAGVSAKQISQKLDCIGVNPVGIGAIFVTHEHSDHVRGLRVFASKYNIPVYATQGTVNALESSCIANGSFEDGLDGWTMDITEAGAQNTLGWVERTEHDAGWYTKNDGRKDGSNLFTFCRPDGTNCENTKGSLRSATFTLKQNSFVSFRFGGAGTRDVYVQLCREDGSVIATFYNEATGKVNTEMYAYYYQYTGEEANCYFRVVDNSTSNYGCFVVDDFRANLESAPEGFIAAIQ